MSDIATINRTYNEFIKKADEKSKQKEYEEAVSLYKSAIEVKPNSLDYPKDKIEKINKILDLKKKIADKSASSAYYKALQLAYKTILNATYGAFANKYFVLSNPRIANAITIMGRNLIRYMVIRTEDYFYNKWHDDKDAHCLLGMEYIAKDSNGKYTFLDRNFRKIGGTYPFLNNNEPGDILLSINIPLNKLKKVDKEINDGKDYEILYEYHLFDPISSVKKLDEDPYWEYDKENEVDFYKGKNPISMYCDTDSIFSSSIISTDNGNMTIEELYNKNISSGSAGNTLMEHESVNCREKVLNWNNDLYYAPVKRIIRHKVSKSKWKLKTKSGKEIIVTNDHSMIVFRNGEKIEVKPSEILKTDKILVINENGEK